MSSDKPAKTYVYYLTTANNKVALNMYLSAEGKLSITPEGMFELFICIIEYLKVTELHTAS